MGSFSLSLANPEASRFIGYEFLATAGYLVIFPDWIGFMELVIPWFESLR